jgi:hypothetical protein
LMLSFAPLAGMAKRLAASSDFRVESGKGARPRQWGPGPR